MVSDLWRLLDGLGLRQAAPGSLGSLALAVWLVAVGTAGLWFATAMVSKWFTTPRTPTPQQRAAAPPAPTRQQLADRATQEFHDNVALISAMPFDDIERKHAIEDERRKLMHRIHKALQ